MYRAFELHYVDLAVEYLQKHVEPLYGVELLQHALLVFVFDNERRSDPVGENARIFYVLGFFEYFRRRLGKIAQILFELFVDHGYAAPDGVIIVLVRGVVHGDVGDKAAVFAAHIPHGGAAQAFRHYLPGASGQLERVFELCHDAYAVDVGYRRFFGLGVALGDEEHLAVVFERAAHGFDRRLARYFKARRHARENDDPAQRNGDERFALDCWRCHVSFTFRALRRLSSRRRSPMPLLLFLWCVRRGGNTVRARRSRARDRADSRPDCIRRRLS